MMIEDLFLPSVIAVMLLDAGLIWTLRLYRRSLQHPESDDAPSRIFLLPQKIAAIRPAAVTVVPASLLALLCFWALSHVRADFRWVLWSLLAVSTVVVFASSALLLWQGSISLPARFGEATTRSGTPRCYGQLPLLTSGLLLAVLAAVLSNYGDRQAQMLAAICWVAGIILTLAAGWRLAPRPAPISWRTIAWITLFVTAGFLVRGLSTGTVPAVLSGDEASVGLSAMDFLNGKASNLFGIGWHGFPSLYYSIQALSIGALGTTSQALRIPSALAGALSVGAIYLMGRSMFGHRAGVFAACILLMSHVHVHFSRLGLNNIWDSLWYVAALGAFWHGWKTGERNAFLLGGLSLGLSLYFYPSARALLVLVPAWLALLLLIHRQRAIQRLPDFAFAGLVAASVALPLAWFYTKNPDEFMGPLRGVSILGDWLPYQTELTGDPAWMVLLRQATLGLLAYTHAPLHYFYLPGTAILRRVPATLFLVGAGLLVLRPKDERSQLLALWLLGFGLIGAVSESTPAAQRYVAAVPACALVLGYVLSVVPDMAERHFARWSLPSTALFAVFTLALALDDGRFYFFDYTPRGNFGGFPALIAQRVTHYLDRGSKDRQLVYIGDDRFRYYANPSLIYLASGVTVTEMLYPWGSEENPTLAGESAVFVVLPGSRSEIGRIKADLRCEATAEEPYRRGDPLYWYFECDLGDPTTGHSPSSFAAPSLSESRRGLPLPIPHVSRPIGELS
jgi:4-amino-4-deoxy-L-arabinose transferase-like glycosyltransferase